MFSFSGNMLVETLIKTAKQQNFTWAQTYAVMQLMQMTNFNQYGEIMDTAVKEAIYDELEFEENFYL